MSDKTIAKITLDKPGSWTKAGRKRIAKWLRSRADWLEKHGDLANATGPFKQSYIIPENSHV